MFGFVAGCAPAVSQPASTAPAAAPPVATHAPGPGEWATWSHAQKLAYMQDVVMPAEREVFARFEPVRFARMDCHTCHGRGADDGTYRMPNPELPKLVGGKPGFGELATVEPEVLRFMQSVVVPETAKLLNVPAFDMEKHVGFSCYQCHTRSDR
jgi:hypothetical protein